LSRDANMSSEDTKPPVMDSAENSKEEIIAGVEDGVVVNASGYKDQLQRQYGLVGLAGIALTVDNAWVALGSSISVSICMGTFLTQSMAWTNVLMGGCVGE